MENILDQIEAESKAVEELRAKLPVIKKVRLHTGNSLYTSPNVYGAYKENGGDCLGISKESFTPMNLSLLLDTIVTSVAESKLDLDLNKIQYNEYKGGRKVTFSVPLKNYTLDTPMIGDVMETSIVFKTGFDSLTKSSISFFTKRLWCANGASRWQSDYSISYKNTKNNVDKYLMFTDKIIKTELDVANYVEELNKLAKKTITKEQIDEFYMNMFGINRHNYLESHKKTQNIMDKINEAVAIEEANTGVNAFSLLQGITRFTTHELAEDDMDLMFGNAAVVNQRAHQLIMSLN